MLHRLALAAVAWLTALPSVLAKVKYYAVLRRIREMVQNPSGSPGKMECPVTRPKHTQMDE